MFNERHQQCSLLSQKPDIYVHHTQNYIVIVKIENKIVQSKILNRKDKIIKALHLHSTYQKYRNLLVNPQLALLSRYIIYWTTLLAIQTLPGSIYIFPITGRVVHSFVLLLCSSR